jgi:branched-chain amino acid transport system ATP-binding protein
VQEALLSCQEVAVVYGGVAALDGVSFELSAHEVCGLIGPNGAGKSTLLNCVSGFVKPTAGRVLVDGSATDRLRPFRVARLGVARTFQHVALMPGCSVRDNVRLAVRRRADQAATDDALARTGIGAIADTPLTALSQGELRRVELARALAARPRLILLDEPFSGLATGEAVQLGGLITEVCADLGIACILVEHNIRLLRTLVERLIALDGGRVVGDGAPSAVLAHEGVVSSYLGAGAGA